MPPPVKLLDRYVLQQVFVTGLFAVAILSVVLVLGNIFKQLLELLVNHDAPWELILSFMAYILPFSLTFTIPWGFLTAVLLVFGKMSAENELIALRAVGISTPRVCVPVFGVALFCVGICLWINVEVAPRAQIKMKDALYNIATNNPLAMFSSDKIIEDFPGRKIYVERNEGAQLFNLLVYEMNDAFDPATVIYARRGLIEPDRENKRLLLHVYDGRFEQRDEKHSDELMKIRQGITMQESTLHISLVELYEKNRKRKGISGLTAGELLERLQADDKAAGNIPEKTALAERSSVITEYNKRFSLSLASLAFVLIGVPLAITAHRKETSFGFLLSVGVAFAYFLFIILADAVRANPRAHPELLIWMPNVIFISLGAVLFYRLSRR
ncbi:MAG: lipopolysaccharide export system permease protein [Chthoniobacter sp.]|jgi:lipopolysaccharide export system permease protein|nr:lipopolysaccharide export system permease protein [Chthoniobacter sp.]